MLKILIENPLLLLFIVAAIGYPLGQIKIRGSSIGVAAVLFIGLGIGSLHPDLKLPEIVYVLGLVLFIYTIGLSSGPAFISSFRREGMRNNLLIVGLVVFSTLLTMLASRILHLSSTLTAGMFTGSLTCTPALAAALETVKHAGPQSMAHAKTADTVVGYSVAYPMGVIGTVLAISLMQRLWRIDYPAEAKKLRRFGIGSEPLSNITIRVTNPAAAGDTIGTLIRRHNWEVIFGRVKHAGRVSLAALETNLTLGDLLTAVGTKQELKRVTGELGEVSPENIDLDRREFDFRRIFVSNQEVVGKPLRELDILQKHGAVVTRVRRGDADLLPTDDMTLELGDRVRVITSRQRMREVSDFFGDSYRSVSEVDILSFSLGLAMGLVVGLIAVPLPGGISFKLGFAGGPLVVALILGAIGRTGPLVWSLPYSVNVTLRQIGLVLFLAGIGTRAGYVFVSTLSNAGGFSIFVAGAVITCLSMLTALWVGYRLFHIPMSILTGMIAGLQTQTAVVGYALEQTKNDLPNIGYASVYPVATICKILAVQLLLSYLP